MLFYLYGYITYNNNYRYISILYLPIMSNFTNWFILLVAPKFFSSLFHS